MHNKVTRSRRIGGGGRDRRRAYDKLYARALDDPQAFGRARPRLSWIAPYTRVKHTSFDAHNVSIKWYETARPMSR